MVKFAHLTSRYAPGDSNESSDSARLAVLHNDSVWFLDELLDDAPRDLQALLEQSENEIERIRSIVKRSSARDNTRRKRSDFHSVSAILRPPAIIAVGLNYAAHATELELASETAPTVFSLLPSSLTGHGQTTSWNESLSAQVDYEVELGVVIGSSARNVTAANALDHVFGYTIVNDITARNVQFSEAQWTRCKSFDGFSPVGPVVVTRDEIVDPQALHLTTSVDGHVVQDASTATMVRSVAEIVSFLSRGTTLAPGTLISTGSPGGAGYSRTPPVFLSDGTSVTVSIEGIGQLTTHCRVY